MQYSEACYRTVEKESIKQMKKKQRKLGVIVVIHTVKVARPQMSFDKKKHVSHLVRCVSFVTLYITEIWFQYKERYPL